MNELVKAVREHAKATADYQTNNWDILLECWDDAEIHRVLFDSEFSPITRESAIARALEVLDLIAEVHFGR